MELLLLFMCKIVLQIKSNRLLIEFMQTFIVTGKKIVAGLGDAE